MKELAPGLKAKFEKRLQKLKRVYNGLYNTNLEERSATHIVTKLYDTYGNYDGIKDGFVKPKNVIINE